MLAIFLPILLGLAALGIDVGLFYFTMTKMQAAADASVLAGASSLPGAPAQARTVTIAYAKINGMLASEISTPVVPVNGLSISVVLTRATTLHFARVLGVFTAPITVTAKAALLNTGAASGVLPLGLSYLTTYSIGQVLTVHKNATNGSGNWNSLALGCTGASCLSNNLANGYAGTVTVGDIIANEPGGAVGPYNSGMNARVAAGAASDPGGTWQVHTMTDQRSSIVPVVDWTGCISGSCNIPVKGFAAVWIVDPSTVIFTGSVVAGAIPSATAGAWGSYRAVLVL